jgi:hypothetical protein
MNRLRRILLILLGVEAGLSPGRVSAAEAMDFNRDIRPILSDNCFACHGPDDKVRKSKLRLDRREDAIHPARSGASAIVPGKPGESELIRRITADHPDDRMPPAETGKTLTQREIELLKQWIASGAEYREHWAFVPPEKSPLPDVSLVGQTPSNPIDAFVAARLEQENLKPAPEADRSTLIRRVTLDLTGLPPTPDEIDAFLADSSAQAYEALVDRLLDSPRYGERMAVDWLDAARYADTHGYHLDSGRDLTPWRDWVIAAYNENKPFDEFTVEQLAGDLLPHATRDQKIATGFNRNHMINYEGGAIPEEYHYAYLVDRVNTTATVWLGLTMACAQCHDHKYDPISKTDYYRFLAFFNNVPEKGLDGNKGNAAPVLRLSTPEQDQKLALLNEALRTAERRLDTDREEIDAAQESWERNLASATALEWKTVLPEQANTTSDAQIEVLEDESLLVKGPNPDKDIYTIRFTPTLPGITAFRVEALPDDSLSRRGPGRAHNGNFLLTGVRLRSESGPVTLKAASADYSQDGYPVSAALDGDTSTGWAVDGSIGMPHRAIFELEQPAPETPLTLILEFQSGTPRHAFGRFRLGITDAAQPHEPIAIPEGLRLVLAKPAPERSTDEEAQVRKFYRERVSPEYRQRRAALESVRKERDAFEATIQTTMVMVETEKPRDTFVRMRGQYDQLGEKVTAATPASLLPMDSGEPVNRLGLARWLVSPAHPLTARVTVNRYWQMYFGNGLVKTAEDFGSQGEWPSHPHLLDWLAREFIDSGWNVKHLQRLIVTSATYRQSSDVTAALFHADPENLLLARGPRFRLQAEFIRDQALAISGLLNSRIGGDSVSPYQPSGLWEELSMREDSKKFSAQFFVQSTGADLYRRSMYTFWKRSSPPPQMSTFDAPDRETCTVRRPRTNTPLQALILLNDPTYLEASRKLAERLMARGDSDDADRIAWAFRLATARAPGPAERSVLLRILEEQRMHYRANVADARELLKTGDSPWNNALDPVELAAWTMLSSTILNLDETLTKG